MKLKQWVGLAACALACHAAVAKDRASQLPLLVIGASYSEGKTPFDNGVAPLGGIAVGFGSYLSLGQALTRTHGLPGYVVNEAQAGGGTFARLSCAPGAPSCGPARWDSYQTQFHKALARVAQPPGLDTYNAKYVVITMPNDCLHADAFGIPQSLSQPCTAAQMNQTVDRLVAVGQDAMSRGITPIYDVYPRYEKLDLPLFRSLFGLAWVIGEADYKQLRQLARMRVNAEVSKAIVVDMWKDFEHIGDGIHPSPETARRGARVVAEEILRRD